MVSEDDLGGCLGGMEGSQGASGGSLGFLGVSGVASESLHPRGVTGGVPRPPEECLGSLGGSWEVLCGPSDVLGGSLGVPPPLCHVY